MRALRHEADFLVYRASSGHWVVSSGSLQSPLTFPEQTMAFECACDLIETGRVEMRDRKGALLALAEFDVEAAHGDP